MVFLKRYLARGFLKTGMEELAIQVFGVPNNKIPEQIASFQTWNDFISCGMMLRNTKDCVSWYLGLLARGVETKFGEKTLDKFAKEIGVSSASLGVYRWVVQQYLKDNPQFQPPERVAFGVLQAIAHLPQEKRQQFLLEAEDGDMSVEKVRIEVQKQQGKPIRPKHTISFCNVHNRWFFLPDNPEEWEVAHEL